MKVAEALAALQRCEPRVPIDEVRAWADRYAYRAADQHEKLRLDLLCALDGVECPVASVLLHRRLAAAAGVSVRELDKALWAYSEANQPRGTR